MKVTVRIVDEGLLRIEWPGRMSDEAKETLYWVLDGIDGVDGIRHGNYCTEVDTALHIAGTPLIGAMVANALLDDERLAYFLSERGWDDLEIQVTP